MLATNPSLDLLLESTRIRIATRAKSPLLSRISSHLVGLPFPHDHYYGTSADGYLLAIIGDERADYVVNLDEDAFVLSPLALLALLKDFISSGSINAGVQDGGAIPIRLHHPCVTNPFFTILHTKMIREQSVRLAELIAADNRYSVVNMMPPERLQLPHNLAPFEPYEDLLIGIFQLGGTMWLNARTHPDGISTTVLNSSGDPVLIHTWYARQLLEDKFTRRRIMGAAREAFASQGHRLPPQITTELLLRVAEAKARRFLRSTRRAFAFRVRRIPGLGSVVARIRK